MTLEEKVSVPYRGMFSELLPARSLMQQGLFPLFAGVAAFCCDMDSGGTRKWLSPLMQSGAGVILSLYIHFNHFQVF